MELSNTVTTETMANWLCFDVRNYIDSIRFESEVLLIDRTANLESLRNRMTALSLYCETALLYNELQKNELSCGGVSISSLMYDITDQLKPIADELGCVVRAKYSHSNNLAFGNKEMIRLATTVLGFELIRALNRHQNANSELVVKTSKKEGRIMLGVYASIHTSPKKILNMLKNIPPLKNPVSFFNDGYPTGVLFVREMLGRAGIVLEPARYGKLSGFNFCLSESEQMSLF